MSPAATKKAFTTAEAGVLRHYVRLENPGAAVPDGEGGFTQTFTRLADVWAQIMPATARDLERVTAGTALSTATHVVTIRYRVGVTTQTRVIFGARIFQVTGVSNPEERNIELVLVCVEVVP